MGSLITDEIERRKTSFIDKIKTSANSMIDKTKQDWAEKKAFNKQLKEREKIGYRNERLKQATLKGRAKAKKGSLLDQILKTPKESGRSTMRKHSTTGSFGLDLKTVGGGAFGELPKKKNDKDNPFL